MQSSDNSINILGFETTSRNRAGILNYVEERLQHNTGFCHLLALNAIKVCKALQNQNLAKAIFDAEMVYPDGFGVAWAMRYKSNIKFDNVPGCELFLDIMKIADHNKSKVFVCGATKEVLQKTNELFKKDFPNTDIVGMRNGYFSSDSERFQVIEMILSHKPDFIFVAMGSPIQERFIQDLHLTAGKNPAVRLIVMGLGGSLDVYTETVKRAPRLFINMRLEWFYRFLTQPFYRLSNTLLVPKFALMFLASHYFNLSKTK